MRYYAGQLQRVRALGRHEARHQEVVAGLDVEPFIEVAKFITEIYSSGMPQAVELIRLNLDQKKNKKMMSEGGSIVLTRVGVVLVLGEYCKKANMLYI